MTASLGIWAEASSSAGVLYRWEADHGTGGCGFVTFEPVSRKFRPADEAGSVLGDLVIDGNSGEATGTAESVDRSVLIKVASSILRAYVRSGEPPKTAHAHFY
ncbi:hypothetical protein [Couchioplanes azureus]|uniref:hypothetical protein n=1 Tax=Couchioplanes caeruleus TaxID=56438 RepID=UPI00166FDB51|nr:hypothetical protein [Couchioplanes caeruleus]GGQ71029.1 hypothetical protein GCM10010166_46400 [Couchioplanes caeruleus subsp. azureus]